MVLGMVLDHCKSVLGGVACLLRTYAVLGIDHLNDVDLSLCRKKTGKIRYSVVFWSRLSISPHKTNYSYEKTLEE